MGRRVRTLKVFCEGDEQREVGERLPILETYDSFVLVKASAEEARRLSKTWPVEDITSLYVLRAGDRTYKTSSPRIDEQGRARPHASYKGVAKLPPGKHHYLVQFIGPIKPEWLRRLARLGAEPRAPHEHFSYVVRCSRDVLGKVSAQPFVRWVGHLRHEDRIDVRTRDGGLPRTRILPGMYSIEFFDAADLARARSAVRKLGIEVVSDDKSRMTVHIDEKHARKAATLLAEASAIHGVRSIHRRALQRTSNDVATGILNVPMSANGAGFPTGKGEILAVCDTGLDSGNAGDLHPDFAGRVAAIKSYPVTTSFGAWVTNVGGDDGASDVDSGHGTHVAGSAVGDGTASAGVPGLTRLVRGPAYDAKLVFQAVEQHVNWKNPGNATKYGRYVLAGIPDDLTTLFSWAYGKGARVHSNSWGGGEPGEYDSQCLDLDRFVWEHRDMCIVVAAGNDGSDADGDGVINRMSVTSPGTAKNCITVGASENLRPQFDHDKYGGWWPQDYPAAPWSQAPMADGPSQVAAFSSRGPTRDGRVKPDVVAPGTFILSTRSRFLSPSTKGWAPLPSSRMYFYEGGTSMAAPLVAGVVACLRQFLREKCRIASPSAALVKACLLSGAVKLPGHSPASQPFDHDQGFGRVDLGAVIDDTPPATHLFVDEDTALRTGESIEGTIQVKAGPAPLRVALAYTDYPGEALVNNLNLVAIDPSGQRYVGNGTAGAGLASDAKNNAEVLHVASPAPGRWTLRVIASNVPKGPQTFACVIAGRVKYVPPGS